VHDFASLRTMMVERQLKARGIRNPSVLAAMLEVPREEFVPSGMAGHAYDDNPLPIGEGQTISQPYMVAYMTEALEPTLTDRVLEIGTGSGYAAAVLSRVVAEVHSVERISVLADIARARLSGLGYDNIHVHVGDGSLGWPEYAPYDAIVVTAGAPKVPQPLLDQLTLGGRLVIPVGPDPRLQTLVRVIRVAETEFRREDHFGVMFVPLIGEAGWEPY
jgi:protein-L-isoaspartate(D-aspartate) O-methyltransferase